MVSISSYLNLAEYAYERRGEPEGTIADFEVVTREYASALGNGFQGVVYRGGSEVIVAFAGTLGGLTTAPISQNTANVRIGVNIIPNMAGSAKKLVKSAARSAMPISIVGHSLGGALAQVVGAWMNIPFVSFNGPGMASHFRWSAFNVFHPRQMRRTIKASSFVPIGLCLSTRNDFVGNFGSHIGVFEQVDPAGMDDDTHHLDAIRIGLGSDLIRRDPSYWVPGFPHQQTSRPNLGVLDFGGPFDTAGLLGRFT